MPYHFITMGYSFMTYNPDRNPLAPLTESVGQKEGHFAREYSVT